MLVKRQQFLGLALIGLATAAPIFATSYDSASAQTLNLNTFRNTALSKHNTYRRVHRSPAMTLNNSVNSTAQAWADHLAATATFVHSTSAQRKGAGENIYAYYTTGTSVTADSMANKAIDAWYNEVKLYNYANPGFSAATGHFTQVVWKDSIQLGCGLSKGTKTFSGTKYNAYYVVCQYNPAGNMAGKFPANVLKP